MTEQIGEPVDPSEAEGAEENDGSVAEADPDNPTPDDPNAPANDNEEGSEVVPSDESPNS